MAKTDFKNVNEYIAAQPTSVQPTLRRVRRAIREGVPSAVEFISYQMPAYKVAGGAFLSLGAWKSHYSLYPASDALMAAFKGALEPYRAGRGTLRFPMSEPVPAAMIARIAKFQAKDAARRTAARQARRQKRSQT
ncbi:MAG TPA: DUF1801 domain-containing protein [Vicinamibacterales bacterium]|nr:DUF1801 domain-containing protein [Vicinamibacterales bacterium]